MRETHSLDQDRGDDMRFQGCGLVVSTVDFEGADRMVSACCGVVEACGEDCGEADEEWVRFYHG